ncbi:hypothetical protein [Nonomuraea roseola]|uniref:Uncharacterized protein n=1 Tax=Nonomuraea roseola TaxID=46179 RepID=A0ABV5PRW3_9ACTN
MVDLGNGVVRSPVGAKPYEDGRKSASKMGSSAALRLAWTTRSAMVGMLAKLAACFGNHHLHLGRLELAGLRRGANLRQEHRP